jgi:N-acetylglutamate synthase-like GNAT family acetyltransferase
MHTSSRFFGGQADVLRIMAFLSAARVNASQPGYWHVGDFLWRLYQNTVFDPFMSVRLWEGGDGQLLGCGALHFYSPTLGEIRSLAVREDAKTHGVGRRLVEELIQEAVGYELDAVFAFTYVVEFFRKTGFHPVERGVLPLKAWKDCLRCPKFQACDEIAVLRFLRFEHGTETQPLWGQALGSSDDQLIQIPTPTPRNL